MEMLGHLKVILPLDINIVQFSRENQCGSHIRKETVSAKDEATYVQEIFSRQQNVRVCPFWKEPTNEVDIKEACTMVVDSDPASDPFLKSYAI